MKIRFTFADVIYWAKWLIIISVFWLVLILGLNLLMGM